MRTGFIKVDPLFDTKDRRIGAFILYLTKWPEKVKPWQGCQSLTHLMKNIPTTKVIQFLVRFC
jgi:hypothetical protein